eukprot:TRINITY_DN20803_c0_g1_i1.p1 TRINITY_DN20803_c0_g1~~TRINITY_DN20803_c0_g1_i1.p1  ORF type:complete len:104 (-),score=8.06 TRINITY_DN20803_c0_g1_i1:23-334(-)
MRQCAKLLFLRYSSKCGRGLHTCNPGLPLLAVLFRILTTQASRPKVSNAAVLGIQQLLQRSVSSLASRVAVVVVVAGCPDLDGGPERLVGGLGHIACSWRFTP